jgi:hypothetical protein
MHLMDMNTFIADTAERSRPYRTIAVAAVLMAAVAFGVMFTVNANRPQPTGGLPAGATTTPSASPVWSPAISPTPSPSTSSRPSPAPSSDAIKYVCGVSTTFTKSSYGLVDAIRTGTHAGYDRLTIEFQGGQPGSIKLQPQTGATFTRDGIGDTVKLLGKDGLLVSMFSTDAHTAYTGTTDIKTGFGGLLEVRVVGDYEGYVHFGLGLSRPACYRATILSNPARLVIDFQTN